MIDLVERAERRGTYTLIKVTDLAALNARVGVSEWQPIETKPKHHFPVLVWGPFGHRVAFEDVAWAWWEPAAIEPMDWKPSHWMPLPARPTATQHRDTGLLGGQTTPSTSPSRCGENMEEP